MGSVASVVVACSGELAPAGGDVRDGGPRDAPVTEGPVRFETGPSGEGCGFCYDSSAAAGLVFQDTQLDQGLCTDAQIDAFYDACFKAGANQASCDAFVGKADASVATNIACLNCVFPFYNPSLDAETAKALSSPAFVLGGQYILPNDEACRFKVANAPSGCGKKATDSLYCALQTCGECDLECHGKCVDLSKKDACKDGLPEPACDAAYMADKAAADAKCGGGAETFETIFKPLAKAFCGTP
jgi:hypothetical protein